MYLYYNNNKDLLRFLIVVDIASYFVYTQIIEGDINGASIKKAFLALFRRGMPKFAVTLFDFFKLLKFYNYIYVDYQSWSRPKYSFK